MTGRKRQGGRPAAPAAAQAAAPAAPEAGPPGDGAGSTDDEQLFLFAERFRLLLPDNDDVAPLPPRGAGRDALLRFLAQYLGEAPLPEVGPGARWARAALWTPALAGRCALTRGGSAPAGCVQPLAAGSAAGPAEGSAVPRAAACPPAPAPPLAGGRPLGGVHGQAVQLAPGRGGRGVRCGRAERLCRAGWGLLPAAEQAARPGCAGRTPWPAYPSASPAGPTSPPACNWPAGWVQRIMRIMRPLRAPVMPWPPAGSRAAR